MKPISLALLLLFSLPFFVALDTSSIWDTNEAYYTQTPREMVERNDWIVPHFNGEPRLNKPPLAYWIVAAVYKLFTPSVFWERLTIASLAFGSVLALFVLGKLLFGEEIALLGAGLFATSFRFLILSRRLLIEVLTLSCLLVALAFFLFWLEKGGKGRFSLSAFFFGLAFLSKGPIALLPVIILGTYLILSRRRLRPAPWVTGGIIFLLVSSSWFVLLGYQIGWQPVIDFFAKENLGRFIYSDFGPQRGPFYYLGVFVTDFFPWSFFFPGAVVWWIRNRPRRPASKDKRALLLLFLWIAIYMLFFSLSHNKQEYYILPVYPVAALGIATFLHHTRLSVFLLSLVSVIMGMVALALFLIVNVLRFEGTFLWVPSLLLLCTISLLIVRKWKGVAASLALFYFSAFGLYSKPLEQYRPVVHFAETIKRLTADSPHPLRAGYYRFATPSLAFYLNRPILELHKLEDAVQHLESPDPLYLILAASDYPQLARVTSVPLEIVEVRLKLYTTARVVIEGFQRGRMGNFRQVSTPSIYLITNKRTDRAKARTVDHRPSVQ